MVLTYTQAEKDLWEEEVNYMASVGLEVRKGRERRSDKQPYQMPVSLFMA